MATIMAVPIAILVAIYIAEYAGPKAASFFRVMLDVLNGVPAILVGIFIYGLLVVGHGQSAIYGAMALAILMIPMVARATQEVLELVPRHLREASLALGVPRWRTVYSIVLPTAIGGMLTGHRDRRRPRRGRDGAAHLHLVDRHVAGRLLRRAQGAADAAGADLHALGIAVPDDQAAAWAAALVLIAFVLVMNILAKFFAGRKRKSLEGI